MCNTTMPTPVNRPRSTEVTLLCSVFLLPHRILADPHNSNVIHQWTYSGTQESQMSLRLYTSRDSSSDSTIGLSARESFRRRRKSMIQNLQVPDVRLRPVWFLLYSFSSRQCSRRRCDANPHPWNRMPRNGSTLLREESRKEMVE